MGGNALKDTITRRYQPDEFNAITTTVINSITKALPNTKIQAVKPYTNKPSFGDLDIVVELLPTTKPTLADHLRNEHITEIIKNSNVWSVGWGDFQVDFIFQPPADFDFSINYYAYNDLGNFIGRIARRLGFKFAHNGLWYELYYNTNRIDTILLTNDFDEALTFLGYDPLLHNKGFDTLDDIFDYTVSSRFFDPTIFDLNNRNHIARSRDSKRPNYIKFLNYIKSHQFKQPNPINKDAQLNRAKHKFPSFELTLSQSIAHHKTKTIVKSKFNGHIVSTITNLHGKELGNLMQHLRRTLSEDTILNSTESELHDIIRQQYLKLI